MPINPDFLELEAEFELYIKPNYLIDFSNKKYRLTFEMGKKYSYKFKALGNLVGEKDYVNENPYTFDTGWKNWGESPF